MLISILIESELLWYRATLRRWDGTTLATARGLSGESAARRLTALATLS